MTLRYSFFDHGEILDTVYFAPHFATSQQPTLLKPIVSTFMRSASSYTEPQPHTSPSLMLCDALYTIPYSHNNTALSFCLAIHYLDCTYMTKVLNILS